MKTLQSERKSGAPLTMAILFAATATMLPVLPALADYRVHASGDFFTWENGVQVPLKFARVEIMDSDSDTDTILDDTLGVGNTDENGHYEIDGSGGDGGSFWWSKPDVYARVDLSDDFPRPLPPFFNGKAHPVRCTDELDSSRSTDTPEHDHDNASGNVNLGGWVWGNKNSDSAPTVWMHSCDVFTNYVSRFNEVPPSGHYDIEYWSGVWAGTPWSNLDTTHWPRHYPTAGGSVNMHEFGHTIRHSLDGNGAHFAGDVIRFAYARSHSNCDDTNPGFAFNEGWAEYWADDVGACNKPLNMEVEGDVANALSQVSKCLEGGGPAGLLQVLKKNPGKIHSFPEFAKCYEQIFHNGCAAKLANPLAIGRHDQAIRSNPEDQQAWIRKEVAAENRKIQELQQQLAIARETVASVASNHISSEFFKNFHSLIRPHLLEASLRSRELARDRVESELRERDEIVKRLNDGTFNLWYSAGKKRYLDQIWTINLAAIADALKAAAPVGKSAEGKVLMGKLSDKLKRFRKSYRAGEPPPLGMQPDLLADEEVTRVPNR